MTNRLPRLSFIVTARDEEPAVLASTIEGLLRTSESYPREVLIVDDGSTTPISLRAESVTVLRNELPLGVSKSRRLGASMTDGEILVVLDAHMSFEVDWLAEALRYVDRETLLCTSFMNYERTRTKSYGARFRWEASALSAITFEGRPTASRRSITSVPMLLGACYLFHREAYERLGGFSPLYRQWGCDEQDLSIRAWMAGLRVRCATSSGVGHLSARSMDYARPPEYLVHNNLALIRTIFERDTARVLEDFLPLPPPQVLRWLDEPEVEAWRAVVQAGREIGDAEFFRRFLPAAPLSFGSQTRARRGHVSRAARSSRSLAELAADAYEPKRSSRPVREADEGTDLTRVPTLAPARRLGLASSRAWSDLEQLRWGGGFTVNICDVALGVRSTRESFLHAALARCREASLEPRPGGLVDGVLSLVADGDHVSAAESGYHLLYNQDSKVALSSEADDLALGLERQLVSLAAETSANHLVVEAAVVVWQGQAIIVVGEGSATDGALVAEMQRQGAELVSSDYVVVDRQGRVYRYPDHERGAPLALRWLVRSRAGSRKLQLRSATRGEGLMWLIEKTFEGTDPSARMTFLRSALLESRVIDLARRSARVAATRLLQVIGVDETGSMGTDPELDLEQSGGASAN